MDENTNINEYTYHGRERHLSFLRNIPENRPRINLLFFILTVASTMIMGPWYCLGIMVFLTSHEMGHYLMCRRYGVRATLPFFIPLPVISPFGTMGAFIQIKSQIPSKKALFDIGAAGPLAGFIIALPLVYFGLKWSDVISVTEISKADFYLGDSLLFKGLSLWSIGAVPDGFEVALHPLAYAGWVGLFVTALNLIPIGQLDGGHIFYSIFGKMSQKANIVFLAGFGIMTVFYPPWFLFFILLLIFGRTHPAPIDNYTPVDNNRRLLGYFLFIILILSFTPTPFKF